MTTRRRRTPYVLPDARALAGHNAKPDHRAKLFDIRENADGRAVLYYGGRAAVEEVSRAWNYFTREWVDISGLDVRVGEFGPELFLGDYPAPPGLFVGSAKLAALDYAARGIPVFPCINRPEKPEKHKRPLTRHGFKDATTDPAIIAGWWKRWPDALIGMPTGPASGIAVLDLDVKKGKNGLDAVPDWATRSTVIARTTSGGIHLYFANDDRVLSQSDKIASGVDTRGNGGYVIVPPSAGYEFTKGDLSDRSTLPPWPVDMFPKERESAEPPPSSEADADSTTDYERARIVAALKVIPSDNYQTWFAVCSALRHSLGDQGFELFIQWSAKSQNYDKEACTKQWDACATVEKITLGTLFHHADNAQPKWREEFEAKHAKPIILTSGEFVAGFQPPDYLIDGVLQRGYLYSTTAPTGTGKTAIALRIAAHVALGQELAGREVLKGKVLYFAGENPDDVRTRWIKLCEEMKVEPKSADVFFVAGTLSIQNMRQRILKEAKIHGPFAMVVVDTLAAYFEGQEENSNVEMARNARRMRSLCEVDGNPTVLVTCHPTKSANPDNLLPRGGGAFVAEVDGNLVCLKQNGIVDLHWQGKFRGQDFSPIPFKIEAGMSEKLKDAKKRPIWTVTARPLTKQEREAAESKGRSIQSQLLAAMKDKGGRLMAELANALGWFYQNGEPNKSLVQRTMNELAARGLVKKGEGGNWTVTNLGKSFAPGDDDAM